MPDLSGKSFEDAKAALVEMGVTGDNILPSPAFDVSDPGTVLKQVPKFEEQFDPKTVTVTLTISKGEETFPMPELIGKTEIEAKAIIEKYNLKLPADKILKEPSYFPINKVFKQFPADKNELVTPGSEVTIWISSGYPPDSIKRDYSVQVSPVVEGKMSTILIKYSDARGDNIEMKPQQISTTTSFPVTLILSPNKDGLITVFVDGQFYASEPVPYADIPADGSVQPDPNAAGDGSVPVPSATPVTP
jgi:serine/threonine-protein kinase